MKSIIVFALSNVVSMLIYSVVIASALKDDPSTIVDKIIKEKSKLTGFEIAKRLEGNPKLYPPLTLFEEKPEILKSLTTILIKEGKNKHLVIRDVIQSFKCQVEELLAAWDKAAKEKLLTFSKPNQCFNEFEEQIKKAGELEHNKASNAYTLLMTNFFNMPTECIEKVLQNYLLKKDVDDTVKEKCYFQNYPVKFEDFVYALKQVRPESISHVKNALNANDSKENPLANLKKAFDQIEKTGEPAKKGLFGSFFNK